MREGTFKVVEASSSRRRRIPCLVACWGIAGVLAGAEAKEIFVPDDHATIQAALDVAVAGDTGGAGGCWGAVYSLPKEQRIIAL